MADLDNKSLKLELIKTVLACDNFKNLKTTKEVIDAAQELFNFIKKPE